MTIEEAEGRLTALRVIVLEAQGLAFLPTRTPDQMLYLLELVEGIKRDLQDEAGGSARGPSSPDSTSFFYESAVRMASKKISRLRCEQVGSEKWQRGLHYIASHLRQAQTQIRASGDSAPGSKEVKPTVPRRNEASNLMFLVL